MRLTPMFLNFADSVVFLCVLLLVLVGTIGCGDELANRAQATGVITLDAKPLEGAEVCFASPDGQSGYSSMTDRRGFYRMDHLDAGKYKVWISIQRADRATGTYVETLPAKYSSQDGTELTADLERGMNTGIDFQLSSRPKP